MEEEAEKSWRPRWGHLWWDLLVMKLQAVREVREASCAQQSIEFYETNKSTV